MHYSHNIGISYVKLSLIPVTILLTLENELKISVPVRSVVEVDDFTNKNRNLQIDQNSQLHYCFWPIVKCK